MGVLGPGAGKPAQRTVHVSVLPRLHWCLPFNGLRFSGRPQISLRSLPFRFNFLVEREGAGVLVGSLFFVTVQ